MKLSWRYLVLAATLLAIEVFLALFVHDDFFRPIMGDALVVILIYSFLRIAWKNSSKELVLVVCLYAFLVEFIQFFDPIGYFNLDDNRFLSVVVGRTFSWMDLLAYSAGSVVNLKIRNWEC